MSKNQQKNAWNQAKTNISQANSETLPVEAAAGANAAANESAAQGNLNTAAGNASTMATTGGFTPQQQTNYLDQATSQARQDANVEENQAQLAAAKTGQGNPQAAISRIARQANQQQGNALQGAQTSLNQQINANKNTGNAQLTGVGSAQGNMANQSAMQQAAAMGLQFNTEAEAQQALDNIANTQKGPLANALQIGQTVAGAVGSI